MRGDVGGCVDGRPNVLKRTISQCHLHDRSASKKAAMTLPHEEHHPQYQIDEREWVATTKIAGEAAPAWVAQDTGCKSDSKNMLLTTRTSPEEEEAVLLPRTVRPCLLDDADGDEPEESPLMFEWHDSPVAMDERFYASVLEAAPFVSPSPHHVYYAATPGDSASTVSMTSTMSHTPSPATFYGGSATIYTQGLPHDAPDHVSARTACGLALEYINEIGLYCHRATALTFEQVGQMIRSLPSAFHYIQTVVRHRLGVSWHLVESFVENLLDFICDEDIREATIGELAGFLRALHHSFGEFLPPGNIFTNLCEFFAYVLNKFKKHLMVLWLQTRKIQSPCEFGKKSPTLFLCMECHREHQ
ncbi:TPA: hypothetical protein N0F65_006870 [Lagenidium giganteum]|uniref:Uncharacterized protein n=1 Tax=Lagenidium giganteum TaxID=4803 RepID=A0AAV2ZCY4_9STRA|nr:TPA: hypothetical protein N0F65_006870 [Lagenidium giganteum]